MPSARKSNAPNNDVTAALVALTEQVAAMSKQLGELTELVRASARAPTRGTPNMPPPPSTNDLETSGATTVMNPNPFAQILLLTLAKLDRDGDRGGKVPLADVRNAFLDRGWTVEEFDARLREAERASIVELQSDLIVVR